MTNKQILRMSLAYIRWNEFGECITPGYDKAIPTAAEIDALLVKAIAASESENPAIEIDKLKQSLARDGAAVVNQEKEIQRLQQLLQQAYERALA